MKRFIAVFVFALLPAVPGNAQTFVPQVRARPADTAEKAAGANKGSMSVYLDGALKGGNDKSGGTSSASTVASGSLGIQTIHPAYSFLAQMTVAAKTDTVTDAFGPSILVPGSGKAFNSGLAEWRHSIRAWMPSAVAGWMKDHGVDDRLRTRVYGTVSTALWHRPDSGSTKHPTVAVVPFGYGAGLSFLVDSATANDKNIAVGLIFGFAQRRIHGDVAGEAYESERQAILGTTKRNFSGYEAGFELQFGDMRGAVTFYSFPNAVSVPGFSRGQVTAGFAIKSDVLTPGK